MNKVSGKKSDFAYIREDGSRIVIGYGLKSDANSENNTWREIYLYKKQVGGLSSGQIRQAILSDINARTEERILSGFIWERKPVWLSSANQMNWKAAYDRAVQTDGENLPLKFKLGEEEDGTPVYHTFTTLNAFGDFTDSWQRHIQQCLNDGWQEKDGIDWANYGISAENAD